MSGEQVLYNRPLPGARVNMAHPLAQGLVGCWLLNEQDGLRAMDSTPYGNHGRLTGFISPIPGRFGGPYFDGTDDRIVITSPPSLPLGAAPCTYEVWFQAQRQPAATLERFLSRGASAFDLEQAGDAAIGGIAANNLGFYVVGSHVDVSETAVANTWYHFVVTYDGITARSYVNAVAKTTQVVTANQSGDLVIGATGSVSYIESRIALVRAWSKALVQSEITALYLSPYAPMGMKMFL